MSISTANANIATFNRFKFTAVGSETSLSGVDDNGNTLSYTVGKEQVYLNGVMLVRGTDYVATDGTSIASLTALTASDVVEVLAYGTFVVATAMGAAQTTAPTAPVEGLIWLKTDGTLADTAYVPLSTVTAAGDIIYASGSGAVTRLGVGTSGQYLTSSGSAPQWSTLSAGDNWTLLNSGGTSLSGTVTTISGISGKNKILVLIQGASPNGSGNGLIGIQLNGDTGSNYYAAGGATQSLSGSAANNIHYAGTSTYFRLVQVGNNTGALADASVMITGCNSSGVKVLSGGGGTAGAGQDYAPNVNYNLQGYYNSSSTITSVSVMLSADSFDAGTVYVYASA